MNTQQERLQKLMDIIKDTPSMKGIIIDKCISKSLSKEHLIDHESNWFETLKIWDKKDFEFTDNGDYDSIYITDGEDNMIYICTNITPLEQELYTIKTIHIPELGSFFIYYY